MNIPQPDTLSEYELDLLRQLAIAEERMIREYERAKQAEAALHKIRNTAAVHSSAMARAIVLVCDEALSAGDKIE